MTPEAREFADHIEALMQGLEGFSIRPMMGIYVMHLQGKVLGFIMEDYLLLEDGPTAQRLLPDLPRQELFPGSKDFVVLSDPGSSGYLRTLAESLYPDLPITKPRKKDKATKTSKAKTETSANQPFWQKHLDE